METSAAPISAVVEALGSAWTIHGLYPDPEKQPAFGRAIDEVKAQSGAEMVLSVSASGFSLGAEEIHTDRQAAERLAKRLFLHNVGLLEVNGHIGARDVVVLFDILAADEADVAGAGGVKAALDREGVTAFAVVEHTALNQAGLDDGTEGVGDEDRDEAVVDVLRQAEEPREFAMAMVAEGAEDPHGVAEMVFERYHDTMARIADGDVNGRELAVQGFVESFFHFDPPVQDAVLERFLDDQERENSRAFLDQFSGAELARFAPRLAGPGLGLLMDYARIVTDPEADSRSEELLSLMEEADAVDAARSAVAQSIMERFDGLRREAETEFDIEMPDPRRHFFTVLEVFRSLMAVESRDDRFDRLMRIWSGKLQGAVRHGSMRRAELWMRAVRDNPTFDPARADAVERAIDTAIDANLMRAMVDCRTEEDDVRGFERFLDVCGTRAVAPLVSLFGTDDRATRRFTTDFLTRLAANHPNSVIRELDGAEWFVARNLTIALRRSGREEARSAVRDLVSHADDRVRTEAVRAVAVLGGEGAVAIVARALTDEDASVRSTALTALGTHGGPEAEEVLVDAVSSSMLTAEQRERAITLLGRDPTPATRNLLERLANRRFAVTGTARSIRDAARKALANSPGGSA